MPLGNGGTIIAVQIPFFYIQLASQQQSIPFTMPIAVAKQGHVVDLSPAALQAGARFSRSLRANQHAVPNLVVVPHTSLSYDELAMRLYDACANITPVVEPGLPQLALANLGKPIMTIAEITATLANACSVPILVGAANVRWMALTAVALLWEKVINDFQNCNSTASPTLLQNSWQAVPVKNEAAFLASLHVKFLLAAQLPNPDAVIGALQSLGITTFAELAQVPIPQLTQQFGRETGLLLHNLAVGKDPTPVKALYPPNKIVVHFHVTEESSGLSNAGSIDQVLVHLCTDLAATLSSRGQAVGTLTLVITLRGTTQRLGRKLRHATMQRDTLLAATRQLWAEAKVKAAVFGLALCGESLQKPQIEQGDVFVNNTGVADGINQAMLSVYSRFGPRSVQKAGQIPLNRREMVRQLWEGEHL